MSVTDRWLGDQPLSSALPALYSHCQCPNISITLSFVNGSWSLPLQNRLSSAASGELQLLMPALQAVVPSVGVPNRRGVGKQLQPFSSSVFYSWHMEKLPVKLFTSSIWHNAATPHAKHTTTILDFARHLKKASEAGTKNNRFC